VRHSRTLFRWGLLCTACCGVAVSQAANDVPHQSQTNADVAVLCNPPVKPTTSVAASVIGANQDSSLRGYLESSVLPIVRANWYRITSKSSERTGGDATVQFTIAKDGSIGSARLTDGAGHAALGDLALDAMSKSAPFPHLPEDAAGPLIEIVATLRYEPVRNDPSTTWPRPPRYSRLCSSDETSKGSADCLVPPKVTYGPGARVHRSCPPKLDPRYCNGKNHGIRGRVSLPRLRRTPPARRS
jgi:TonB family protein